ncbi:MAG: glycogen debranching protein [Firmicutes bacterium HGW-Firmicutes-14]|nr:MAG: glycogen debranching protein [Firmicutes bacterium HGW-Firmicutes-14]
MIFSRNELGVFERSADKQWVVTNGLGGFASSTITGANTSKYNGLLFAAFRPPGDRTLLLAKLEEEITVNGNSYSLGSNHTGTGIFPAGYNHLQSFELRPFPTFTFSFGGVIVEKVVFMVREANITISRYTLYTGAGGRANLKITPLVNCRHYHHTIKRNDWPFNQETTDKSVIIEAYPGAPKLKLYSDKAVYERGPGYWFEHMYYKQEDQRGLDPWEDHFMPGYFEVALSDGESFSIIASTEGEKEVKNPFLEQVGAERRLAQLVEEAGFQEEFVNRLILAADSFIVNRQSTGAKTVIAGYPWFTDWGRDTMIALPGLTLVTRRFGEAREILHTFAGYCEKGLIPNMFPDQGEKPLYNTVDAPLWFFHAAYKYISYTGDYDFIREEIYPVLKDIIRYYREGTLFNIGMDKDGLISAGEYGIQLTWMDAKAGDWVVTPRHGKPVEINALWYNALEVMNRLAAKFKDKKEDYAGLAARARNGFLEKFWNPGQACLYDVILDEGKDDSIRPNQIFAVSLPFSPLDHGKQVHVVNTVWRELYFSFGLRSLSPASHEYHGRYFGNVVQRDEAYHQGTGWAWLAGPFITAYRRVNDYSAESKTVAERFIAPFKAHLWDHGIGSVSEVFDGDPPHYPRGCFSQAWSVAEVLRAYVEDIMGVIPDRQI